MTLINKMTQDELYNRIGDSNLLQLDDLVYQLNCFLQRYPVEHQIAAISFYFLCMVDRLGLQPSTFMSLLDNIRRRYDMPAMRSVWDYMTNEWR